jgi:hypothetical protein
VPVTLLGMDFEAATVELFKVIADDMKAVARVIASLDGQQHAVSESRLLAIHLLDLQQRWLRLASGEREIVQLH